MNETQPPNSPDRPPAAPRSVDWGELHRRVQSVAQRIEGGFAPSSAQAQEILRNRAQGLAVAPPDPLSAREQIQVLAFRLADEIYAVESACVREVWPLRDLTPLPGVPPFVLGIINVRGTIFSVINLKRFFDLPERGLRELDKAVLLHSPAMQFGILADALLGVRSVALSALQAPLPTLASVRVEYVKGVTTDGWIILDAAKLLADPKIVVNHGS